MNLSVVGKEEIPVGNHAFLRVHVFLEGLDHW